MSPQFWVPGAVIFVAVVFGAALHLAGWAFMLRRRRK